MLNQYRGFKRLEVFLAAVVLMASAFAGGTAGRALAQTGRGGAGAAIGTPSNASPRPSGNGEKEENDETENIPGAPLNLSIDGYEIYAVAGSRDTLDTLRKGRQAKVLVHVKGAGIRTKDVGKTNISVTKLNDSFKMSGNPKVKVTSEKEDDLEFTVTFARLTYLGKGNGLKFRTSFKKAGIPSEIQEAAILECEESYPGEHGDSGSTNGQPVIKVRRIGPQAPVGPGDHFTLELDMENTSSDADIEDMVVTVSPGGFRVYRG